MTFKDILHETHSALSSNKIRSGLTMLGIIIGISSVIAMMAIGTGAQNTIEASIQSIGSNLVIVTPGAQQGPGVTVSAGRGSARTLTYDDAKALSSIPGISAVAPEVTSRYQITAKGTNTNTQVIGTVSAYPTVRNIQIAEGSFISDTQVQNGAKVAVLGPTTRDDLFGEGADAIGQSIRINGNIFKIIGITVSKGGSGFSNADDVIYIPLITAQRYLSGNEYVTSISVAAENAQVTSQVQTDITTLLLDRHNITDPTKPDFSTLNQADIIATASSITNTFTILLAAVAGISLVVGGIGIMNMMLTTVTERTREIGLRKAIGAKRSDISRQFLIEAVAITFLGGFVGVLLGWVIAFIISLSGLIQAEVSISSIVLAFGVSTIIGIIFGYYPAQRAAKLNPIEALRYE